MQAMDNSEGLIPLTIRKITFEKLVGAEFGDWVVLFSKTGEKLTDKFEFTLTMNGSNKVLITDLAQGKWKVMREDGTVSGQYVVTRDGCALYFHGGKGKYLLSRAD
jgi:hypothetical protein